MSTPRTDAEAFEFTDASEEHCMEHIEHNTQGYLVHASFARQLETELAAAKERLAACNQTKMSFLESLETAQHERDIANNKLAEIEDENARLRESMEKLRLSHYECEDPWYSCPKCNEGCADDRQGDECNCGADEHNAIIDAARKGKA